MPQLAVRPFPKLVLLVVIGLSSGVAPAKSCDEEIAEGESRGKLLPDQRRTYEEYQTYQRAKLELERNSNPASGSRILKEVLSLEHQGSLIERTREVVDAVAPRLAAKPGLPLGRVKQAIRDAIADSDKGKLKEFQDLAFGFPGATPAQLIRSNTLLDLLSLRPSSNAKLTEAQKLLERVLVEDYGGVQGQGILSRRYTNDQIRDVINKNFFLKGALHDLPGIYDAYVEFANTGNAEIFMLRLRANFSHNGPGRTPNPAEGFWGFFFLDLVPKQLNANGAGDFFRETIYWRDGAIRYPEGASTAWFAHTATDRMQGAVNLKKFIAERPVGDDLDALIGAFRATSVLKQLDQIADRLGQVEGRLNDPAGVDALRQHVNKLRNAQDAYGAALAKRLRYPASVGGKFDSFETLDGAGQLLARYRVDRNATGGPQVLRNDQAITREQLLDALDKELFLPLRELDPLLLK